MAKINLTTKLTLGVATLTTVMVVMTTIGIGYGVYSVTESKVRDELIGDVNNAINNNLTIIDGQIRQKDQVDGQTLGVVLRGKELSALIVSTDGTVLARYGIYHDLSANFLKIESIDKSVYEDITIANYGLFDVYTAPIRAGNDIFGYIRMVRKNTEIAILQSAILTVTLVLLPLSWVIAIGFSYFMAKRITEPMTKLVDHLESIKPESMQIIVDSPKMDHEIYVVTSALNDLILRLRNNLKREHQITENISHEFKTPLTRIASNLQVGNVKDAELEILELGGNVDALLSLAIWEKTDETCDLVPIIKHLVKLIPSNFDNTITIPKKLIVPLPSSHAIVIWRNILDNAIKHNSKNGYIKIIGTQEKNDWSLTILNSTKSKTPKIPKITQRKYKFGESAGHGIGMSIVADMCLLHNLHLDIDENEGEVRVVVSGKV